MSLPSSYEISEMCEYIYLYHYGIVVNLLKTGTCPLNDITLEFSRSTAILNSLAMCKLEQVKYNEALLNSTALQLQTARTLCSCLFLTSVKQ